MLYKKKSDNNACKLSVNKNVNDDSDNEQRRIDMSMN